MSYSVVRPTDLDASSKATASSCSYFSGVGVLTVTAVFIALSLIVILTTLGELGDLTSSSSSSGTIVSLTNWVTAPFGTNYTGGYTQVSGTRFIVNGSGPAFYAGTATYGGQALYQNVTGDFILSCVLLINNLSLVNSQVGVFVTSAIEDMTTSNTMGIDITNTGTEVTLETNEAAYAAVSASIGQNYIAIIMERVDTTITIQYSLDGLTYTLVTPQGELIAGSASVGMFVTSHQEGNYSEGVFYNVSLLVSDATYPSDLPVSTWESQPFGTIYTGTVAQNNATTFTISGSGEDVNVGANIYAGQAAFQVQAGNFTLSALVVNPSTVTGSKVGIFVTNNVQGMFRSNTVVLYIVNTGSGVYTLEGGSPGAYTIGTVAGGIQWLRAYKDWTTVTLAYSSDGGATYTNVTSNTNQVLFPVNATVGLFVTSGDDGKFVNGLFYNVVVIP